ncbi:hypothetical protein R3Q06_28015 [Rhodococcus erythropolis]|uniref:hypothetical protein n=1 Tax=Rhodococcus erythropolis TaxID=1833 RepID=UPI00294A936A|nr:hypothetical protein [Rhodococcus erythropolis]MDV6277348.1 hypothetical protein [Rhodococcus erythropolis]
MTRTRTRKMLHSTVGAVAVLTAISTGAGISAAAPTGSAAPDLPGTTQTSPYQWSVQNQTDQTLANGHWTVSEAGGASSTINFGATPADWPGGTVTATQDYSGKALTWSASFCHLGTQWASGPDVPKMDTKTSTTFKLIYDRGHLIVGYSNSGQSYVLQPTGRC